jgi:hypothetical protein
MVYRSHDPSELGPRRASARTVIAPRLVLALAILQLPIVIAAIVLAVRHQWRACGALAAGYVVVALARFTLVRQRAQLHVHDQGLAVERGATIRSWRWDELARMTAFAVQTRAGERLSLVADQASDLARAALGERWTQHALARARATIAAGGAVAFQHDALRVRADGLERFGVVVPWREARIDEHDGYIIVMSTFDQSLAMVQRRQRGAVGLALHDHDVPEGPVFRALVREHRPAHAPAAAPVAAPDTVDDPT